MLALGQTMSAMYWNKTTAATDFNRTAIASKFNKTSAASNLNLSTIDCHVNHSMPTSDFNGTTPVLDANKTTPDWCFNETNITFAVDSDSTSTNRLTYALFGLTLCLTLLGLIGNGLILASMFKVKGRSKGHGKLITSLAICDSFAVVSWAIEQWCVHAVLGLDIRAVSTWVCKLSLAILFTSVICSTGIVVLICLERFTAVWFPLRSRILLTDKNILRAILVCTIPFVLTFVVMSVLYVETKDGLCLPNFNGEIYSTVLNRYPNTIFYRTFGLGVPLASSMLILTIFTPLTIMKLYKQRDKRHRLVATSGPNSQLNATEFKTSVKLMAVVIAQLVLNGLPSAVTILVFGLKKDTIEENTLSAITLACLMNHSINFILFNVFDKEFRKNIVALFRFDKKDKNINNRKNVPLHAKTNVVVSNQVTTNL